MVSIWDLRSSHFSMIYWMAFLRGAFMMCTSYHSLMPKTKAGIFSNS